jgi:adenine-specific DNA methylase
MSLRKKTPWQTKAVMTQIYDLGFWGKGSVEDKFYSGDGSHDPKIIEPYIQFVQEFLQSFKEKISLVDLGCGDFNVGKNFVQFTQKYFALDVVEELIAYNSQKFNFPNIEFLSLDIVKNDLPKADCAIIRQVLQHLSNKEIGLLIPKLAQYQYIILTEHIPDGDFIANKDIITGQGIRLKQNSGVDVTKEPFNLKPIHITLISKSQHTNYKGVVETKLYQMF